MAKQKKKKRSTDYRGSQTLQMGFPPQFTHLCRMLEVTPKMIITDLVWSISGSVTVSATTGMSLGKEYFLSKRYGYEKFKPEQVRQMVFELGIVEGLIPPFKGKMEGELDEYFKMRNAYFIAWKNKWERIKKRSAKPS
jgi:hypothetical protein